MSLEMWKDILNYENLYKISDKGNVYSYLSKRILIAQDSRTGYLKINLYKNGKMKTHAIHKLVGIAFIPNIENKKCINHIDYNRKNNFVENLQWCTHKENTHHSYDRIILATGNNFKKINDFGLMKRPVIMFSSSGEIIKEFDSVKDASIAMCGKISSNIVNFIVREKQNKQKLAYGYKWAYKN